MEDFAKGVICKYKLTINLPKKAGLKRSIFVYIVYEAFYRLLWCRWLGSYMVGYVTSPPCFQNSPRNNINITRRLENYILDIQGKTNFCNSLINAIRKRLNTKMHCINFCAQY